MAIYPGAVPFLLPQNAAGSAGSEAIARMTLVVLHTNGGNNTLEGSYNYWKRNPDGTSVADGKEAHFQLETDAAHGGKGRLGQYMDTTRRADSTGVANAFTRNGIRCGSISIETADNGSPYQLSWTDLGQRAQLEDFLVWACRTHGIEAKLAVPNPAGGWDGIGYHRQYPEWNPNGHVCPGDGKQREVPDLIAAVAARLQGDDMSQADVDAINAHTDAKVQALRDELFGKTPPGAGLFTVQLPARYGAPAGPAEERLTAARVDAGTASTAATKVEAGTGRWPGSVNTALVNLATDHAAQSIVLKDIQTKLQALIDAGGNADVAAILAGVKDLLGKQVATTAVAP